MCVGMAKYDTMGRDLAILGYMGVYEATWGQNHSRLCGAFLLCNIQQLEPMSLHKVMDRRFLAQPFIWCSKYLVYQLVTLHCTGLLVEHMISYTLGSVIYNYINVG